MRTDIEEMNEPTTMFLMRASATFRRLLPLLLLLVTFRATAGEPKRAAVPVNPAIDMSGYLLVSKEAAEHRESRRVTEDEFIRMSEEPGTIILDARSREKYDELHVRGAISLSFPDINIESLKATIPDRETRILIYCNNNFFGDESAFASKIAVASLNLSTYIALYSYGYRNVYELAPFLDMKKAKITFEGSSR
jgi:rhodanese-related sulfurtransferase